ncbi:type II toxin-antitoxin system HicB family antitoxin [candidate division KSB1 bacterium]|nr:type II toxin-antitoxin system HicB family antitoxin [candidate division KSB1 bacterium]
MKSSIEMSLKFRLPLTIKKEDGVFISCCPILDVYSQGYTEKEARDNLKEALVMFLESCIERGTLDTILKECGFKLSHEETLSTKPSLPRNSYIDIPIPLIASSSSRRVCHA